MWNFQKYKGTEMRESYQQGLEVHLILQKNRQQDSSGRITCEPPQKEERMKPFGTVHSLIQYNTIAMKRKVSVLRDPTLLHYPPA